MGGRIYLLVTLKRLSCLSVTCIITSPFFFLLSLFCFLQVNIFTEEIIRAGSAASLSSLLNRLDPVLRKTAHLGRLVILFP